MLAKAIDPLHASGTDLHEAIMRCLKSAIGEKDFFDGPPEQADHPPEQADRPLSKLTNRPRNPTDPSALNLPLIRY